MRAELDRPVWVQAAFRDYVRGVGFFWRSIRSQLMFFAINTNLSHPFLLVRTDTKQTIPVVGLGCAPVLGIFPISCYSKVIDSIVRSISVNVIDMATRPFSVEMQPSKPMRKVSLPIDASHDITCWSDTRDDATNAPALANSNFPNKKPGIRVVVKNFAQALRSKIGGSHEALLLLIGQRPACVGSTCGLRYFRPPMGFYQPFNSRS